jgi:hypothetical protein
VFIMTDISRLFYPCRYAYRRASENAPSRRERLLRLQLKRYNGAASVGRKIPVARRPGWRKGTTDFPDDRETA